MEGETLKLLARAAAPVEGVAAGAGAAGLRVHIESAEAVDAVAALLERFRNGSGPAAKASGPVYLCIADLARRVEYDLQVGDKLPVSPEVRGALRSLTGVLAVDEV